MATEFAQKVLQLHNAYRGQHGASPLEWSDELEKAAIDHSNLLLESSEDEVPPVKTEEVKKFGQNILEGKGKGRISNDELIQEAIHTWYEDVGNYDPASTSESKGGNFTQLVWKASLRIGMSIARKEEDGITTIVVLALYDPPGNMKDQFDANVCTETWASLRPGEVEAQSNGAPSQSQEGLTPAPAPAAAPEISQKEAAAVTHEVNQNEQGAAVTPEVATQVSDAPVVIPETQKQEAPVAVAPSTEQTPVEAEPPKAQETISPVTAVAEPVAVAPIETEKTESVPEKVEELVTSGQELEPDCHVVDVIPKAPTSTPESVPVEATQVSEPPPTPAPVPAPEPAVVAPEPEPIPEPEPEPAPVEVKVEPIIASLPNEAIDRMVKLHNEHRGKHGSPSMKLEQKLCEEAQTLAFAILTNTAAEIEGKNVWRLEGSSIDPQEGMEKAVEEWYSKSGDYKWIAPITSEATSHPFCKLVWASSRKIGVGMATEGSKATVIVAVYSPPSNFSTEKLFRANVRPDLF